jgi:hypothetical protein
MQLKWVLLVYIRQNPQHEFSLEKHAGSQRFATCVLLSQAHLALVAPAMSLGYIEPKPVRGQ